MIITKLSADLTLENLLEQNWVSNAAPVLDAPENQSILEQYVNEGMAEGELTIPEEAIEAPTLEEDGFHTFVLLPKEIELDVIIASEAGVLKPNLPFELFIDEETTIAGTTDGEARLQLSFETYESMGLIKYSDPHDGIIYQLVKFDSVRQPFETDKGIDTRLAERGFNKAFDFESSEDQTNEAHPKLTEYWAEYSELLA